MNRASVKRSLELMALIEAVRRVARTGPAGSETKPRLTVPTG